MRPDSTTLRVALFTAAATAQLAALTTHLVSTTIGGLGLALLVMAWAIHGRQQSVESVTRYVSLAAAVAAMLLAGYGAAHVGNGLAVHAFAPLLVVLQSVLLVNHDRRSVRLVLMLSIGLLIAAASVASTVIGGLPILISLGVVLLTITIARRVALVERAQGQVAEGCCPKHPPKSVGSRAGVAAVCLVTALIGWLLLPPAFAGDLHHRIGKGDPNVPHVTTPTTLAALSGSDLDLRVRGQLSDEPILEVSAASPLLWRGAIYSSYNGTTWNRVRRTSVQRVLGDGTNHALDAVIPEPPPHGRVRNDTAAAYLPAFDGTVVAPGAPVDVITNSDVFADGSGSYLLTPARSYVVRSVVAPVDAATLTAASGSDPVDPTWTQLPASVPPRVLELARHIAGGASSRYAAVIDVEQWLQSHATYRLDSPVPGYGEDAVDDFLFRDHTGFCEQFAAAETVMLRALDIPARLVTGLAYGEASRQPGLRLFRASDAHAWVEVYYPGLGWSPSDPTAGTRLGVSGRSWDSRVRAALQGMTTRLGGRKGVAVALMVLLCAVLLVTGWWRKRQRPVAATVARRDGPVLGAFRVLEARLSAAEPSLVARAPAESVREYLHRVGLGATLEAPLGVLETECYGGRPPDYALATSAADAFLRAAAAVAPAEVS